MRGRWNPAAASQEMCNALVDQLGILGLRGSQIGTDFFAGIIA